METAIGGGDCVGMAYLSVCNSPFVAKWRHRYNIKKKRLIHTTTVAKEQLPKSPRHLASLLRTSLQQCLHQRQNRILVDIEDNIPLQVENSSAKDKTKRELARLVIEMFYGTQIPVSVAFSDPKELQVAQSTWGASTQWVNCYHLMDNVGKRGFQRGLSELEYAEEQVVICVDPKPRQLLLLETQLQGAGQVVVLVNPRRIQQNTNLLVSLRDITERYTPALVMRRYMLQG